MLASPLQVGREIYWEGSGVDEVAKEKKTGIIRVTINPKFFRPDEVVRVSLTFADKLQLFGSLIKTQQGFRS